MSEYFIRFNTDGSPEKRWASTGGPQGDGMLQGASEPDYVSELVAAVDELIDILELCEARAARSSVLLKLCFRRWVFWELARDAKWLAKRT